MSVREPILHPVAIEDLRPTQITVGMHEVAEKRLHWRELAESKAGDFLGRHMIPVVLGPKARPYVIDHHHLARALHEEGVKEILTNPVADLRALSKDAFWIYMDNRGWCHPYDAEGRRGGFDDIPKSIDALADDPYRSLAGALRRAGGFAQDPTPVREVIWADFLRRRIKPASVHKNFAAALDKALALAKQQDAAFLPGWCGPVPVS